MGSNSNGFCRVFYEGAFLLGIVQAVVPEKMTSRIPMLRSTVSENSTPQQNDDKDEGTKEL